MLNAAGKYVPLVEAVEVKFLVDCMWLKNRILKTVLFHSTVKSTVLPTIFMAFMTID